MKQRSVKHRLFSVIGLLIISSLVIGACQAAPATPTEPVSVAPTETSQSAEATEANEAPASTPTSLPEPTPAEAGPKTGGILIVGIEQDPPGLDPQSTSSTNILRLTSLVFDTLVQQDLSVVPPAGEPPPIVPGLAERWEVSEDALTYTFYLRQGVVFHDGTPFTADAVKATFERGLEGTPGFYEEAQRNTSLLLSRVSSIEVVDEFTVAITLKAPFASIIDVLTSRNLAILNPVTLAAYPNEEILNHPIGTGPFKFVENERGVKLVMERNDDYWGTTPYLDQVIFRPIPDATARLAALKVGEIHLDQSPDPDAIQEFQSDSNFVVYFKNNPLIWQWALHTQRAPLNDVNLRLAMNWAIDRESLARDILNGVASPLTTMFPPGNPAHIPGQSCYGYDPQKAAEYLAQSNYKGEPIKVWFPVTGPTFIASVRIHEFLAAELQKVGINIVLEGRENNVWLDGLTEGMPADMNASAAAWASTAHLPYIFNQLLHTRFISPAGNNRAHYSNPEVDALLDLANENPDPAASIEFYRQAEALACQDAPWLVVITATNPVVTSAAVKGYIGAPSLYYQLSTVWLDASGQ